jgi:cytidylate kinase
MGSGKSSTSRALARLLNRVYVSTDEMIVDREGRTIAQMEEKYSLFIKTIFAMNILSSAIQVTLKSLIFHLNRYLQSHFAKLLSLSLIK